MYSDATGEFWILHGSAVIEGSNDRCLLELAWVFQGWATALRRAHWLLDHFEALPARRVEVGFTGMETVRFPGGWNISSPPARRNILKFDQTRRDWSNPAAQEAFLAEAFDEVFGLFGLDRPSPAETLAFVRENDWERQLENPYG